MTPGGWPCGRTAAFFAVLLAMLAPTALGQASGERGSTRIVIFGDFNGPYGSTTYPPAVRRVVDAIVGEWRPDGVVFTGDVVAGQSHALTRSDLDAMWAAFDESVASRLRSAGIPYGLAVGNHDASSLRSTGGYAFATDREAAADYLSQPVHVAGLAVTDGPHPPFDRSFLIGDVFVAVLDASSAAVTPEQREWLQDVLASAPAATAAARLVVGHLPLVPVSVGRDAAGEYLADGESLADLLATSCVTAYVSGHHAAYYPGVWRGLEVLAAGGVGARRLLGSDARPRSTVTVIDVWTEPPRIRYQTYDADTLYELSASELPASLPTGVVLSGRAGAVAPLDCVPHGTAAREASLR